MNLWELSQIFDKYDSAELERWEAYGQAFALVDAGTHTLLEVMDAAHLIGIAPSVVKMRRTQYLKMSETTGPAWVGNQTISNGGPRD